MKALSPTSRKVAIVPEPDGTNPNQTTIAKTNKDSHKEYDLTHKSYRESITLGTPAGRIVRKNSCASTAVCHA